MHGLEFFLKGDLIMGNFPVADYFISVQKGEYQGEIFLEDEVLGPFFYQSHDEDYVYLKTLEGNVLYVDYKNYDGDWLLVEGVEEGFYGGYFLDISLN